MLSLLNFIQSSINIKLMGALGSKEKLGQIGVIYGYNSNDFAWKNVDNRKIYCTSGLIISHNGFRYVITTRSKLISCKNIVMYHRYFRESDPIMRNDLRILFQSIEYNIIILVTHGDNKFDPLRSDIISGDYHPKLMCPSYTIPINKFIVPTKRSHYYTVKTDMDLVSDTINYDVHIYDAKFIKSVVYNKSYLFDNYMHEYQVITPKTTNEPNLLGICGATIFNKKMQLMGIVSMSEMNKLWIIPTKILSKVVYDFLNVMDNAQAYTGTLSLPFLYKIHGTSVKLISDCTMDIENQETILLKKNDILLKINNKPIVCQQKQAFVFDDDFKDNIPIDIYLRIHCRILVPVIIEIKRRSYIFQCAVLPSQIKQLLCFTNQPILYPGPVIPFVNISGIIIAQITHELLDITISNDIILYNENIINFMDGTDNQFNHLLMIIDCLDNTLAEKYNLPQMKLINSPNGKKRKAQKINCPIITKINDTELFTLHQLQTVCSNVPDFKVIDETWYFNTEIIITAGTSYDNQLPIKI